MWDRILPIGETFCEVVEKIVRKHFQN